jgi:hypothetical protein
MKPAWNVFPDQNGEQVPRVHLKSPLTTSAGDYLLYMLPGKRDSQEPDPAKIG